MARLPRSRVLEHADSLAGDLAAIARREADRVAASLRAATMRPVGWWDGHRIENDIAAAVQPRVQATAVDSGQVVTADLDGSEFAADHDVEGYVRDRTHAVSAGLAATMRDDIARRMDDAADEEGAADAVSAWGSETARPSVVATAEAFSAVAFGALAGGRQVEERSDGQVTKTWVTAGDDAVDEDCSAYEGASVALGDSFNEGDPPLHFGCRCELEIDLLPSEEDAVTAGAKTEAPRADRRVTFSGGQIEALTAAAAKRGWDFRLGAGLTAAADGSVSVEPGGEWHSVALVEDYTTTDGREFAPGSLRTRELPLPLMCLDTTTWGHETAIICGAIETATREDSRIITTGFFDVGEAGIQAQGYVERQVLRWVSVDVEVLAYELVIDGEATDGIDFWDLLFGGGDIVERYTDANLMGATICPFPAFPQAVITMSDVPLPASSDGEATDLGGSSPVLVASGGTAFWWAGAEHPPAEWFEDPELPHLTHLTVTPDGRVYGHLALWEQRHVGFRDRVVKPPHSRSAYAYYRTGLTTAAGPDGTVDVATGPLTMGTCHADLALSYRSAAEHYDHTGHGVADLACGEDAHGIWVAGAVRPSATAEQLRVLRASDVSGDWREIGIGGLEMIGALVVNAGGFPIPRSLAAAAADIWPDSGLLRARYEGDRPTALVAAGVVRSDAWEALAAMRRELAAMRPVIQALKPLALRELAGRVLRDSA